jgi:hypothetical protein
MSIAMSGVAHMHIKLVDVRDPGLVKSGGGFQPIMSAAGIEGLVINGAPDGEVILMDR